MLCAFLTTIFNSFGQSTPSAPPIGFDLKKTLPTSPEVAALGRFGEIPIGSYTGTANISIPLYSVNTGGISIPLTLNYQSSGIKVDDEATWVGLGWNLSGVGSIMKIFNGKEDNGVDLSAIDQTGYQYLYARSLTGVYSKTTEIGFSTWSCPGAWPPVYNGPSQDSAPILNALLNGEGQPDLYQYNLPGGVSGKFFINPRTQAIVLIDKKDSLLIKKEQGESGFTVTTPQGNKYIYNIIETSYTDALTSYSGKTWKLSQIIANNGKMIEFGYTIGGSSSISYNETYHDDYPLQPISINDYGVVKRTMNPTSQLQILTQIKTDNILVNFNLDDRLDIAPSIQKDANGNYLKSKLLRSMDIVDRKNGAMIKSFDFSYSYFSSSTDPASTFFSSGPLNQRYTLRLKLDSLSEVGRSKSGVAIRIPSYKFTYNTTPLPAKVSYSQDFWGYYNGKSNTMLIPSLNYFYYSNFDNYHDVPAATLNAFSGANRTVDTNKITAGMLTKIKYPTGGYSEFNYESNRFSNYNYPDINSLNTNISNVTVSDYNKNSDNSTSSFTLTTAQNVQFSVYIQGGPVPTAPSFSAMQPSTVTLSKTVNGTTSIVKQWQMGTIDQQTYNDAKAVKWLNDPVALAANTQYSITTSLPDGLGAQNTAINQANVTCIFNYLTPQTNVEVISNGGGLRIANISNYNSDGGLITKRVYKYINTDGSSSGKLMSNLAYLYSNKILSDVQYGTLGRGDFINRAALKTIWFVSSQSSVPYSSSAGGFPVGYSRVEEIEVGPTGIENGKRVNYYFNVPDQTQVNLPSIPDLRNGLIIEEDILNSIGDTIRKVNNYYSDHNTIAISPQGSSYTGAKIVRNFVGADPCYRFELEVDGQFNYVPVLMPAKHDIYFYPIKSAWFLLSKRTQKDFIGTSFGTVSQGFKYNVLGQLVRDSLINSKGDLITTVSQYPVDIPIGERSITQQMLVDSSFLDQTLAQYRFVNSSKVSQVRVGYSLLNQQLVRSKIERSVGSAPFYADTDFDQYGPNKTLRQVTQKGLTTVLIWSYNHNHIVAEIKNTTFSAVAALVGGQTSIDNFGKEFPTKERIDSFLSIVKNSLSGVQMTTYTYDPLVGITSITDAKGLTSYYEYDGFQRLVTIRDQNKNIVKNICYNYANQQTGCVVTPPTTPTTPTTPVTPFVKLETGAGYLGSDSHYYGSFVFKTFSDAAFASPYNVPANFSVQYRVTLTTTNGGSAPVVTSSIYTTSIAASTNSRTITLDVNTCGQAVIPNAVANKTTVQQTISGGGSTNVLPPGGGGGGGGDTTCTTATVELVETVNEQ